MHNARFKLMAGLAGATMCLFAVTSYGQQTNTTTGTTDGTGGAATAQTTPAPDASTQAPTTTGTVTTGTETQTTTTTTSFPGGVLGILAVAVLVLLILFALFRGRDRTEIRETSVASSASTPGARTTAGTAGGERMNLDSRAASGSTTTSSGINDPNTRR